MNILGSVVCGQPATKCESRLMDGRTDQPTIPVHLPNINLNRWQPQGRRGGDGALPDPGCTSSIQHPARYLDLSVFLFHYLFLLSRIFQFLSTETVQIGPDRIPVANMMDCRLESHVHSWSDSLPCRVRTEQCDFGWRGPAKPTALRPMRGRPVA